MLKGVKNYGRNNQKENEVTECKVKWFDRKLDKVVEQEHTIYKSLTKEKLEKKLKVANPDSVLLDITNYEIKEYMFEIGLVDFINYSTKTEIKKGEK